MNPSIFDDTHMCKVYALYKCANTLYRKGVPVLPRMIYYLMRFLFTTSVPHTVKIGRNTRFNNWGMGTVVHRRATIGENCMIAHGVTIGCLDLPVGATTKNGAISTSSIGPCRPCRLPFAGRAAAPAIAFAVASIIK